MNEHAWLGAIEPGTEVIIRHHGKDTIQTVDDVNGFYIRVGNRKFRVIDGRLMGGGNEQAYIMPATTERLATARAFMARRELERALADRFAWHQQRAEIGMGKWFPYLSDDQIRAMLDIMGGNFVTREPAP